MQRQQRSGDLPGAWLVGGYGAARAIPGPAPASERTREHVARIVEERAARLGQPLPAPPPDPNLLPAELTFDVYAYICGLNNMVSGVREKLAAYGWHRKQIVFERYD